MVDGAATLGVERPVHLTHAASPEEGLQAVRP